MTLDRYLGWVRGLPPPTAEQAKAFPQFVSQVHSWYKHLPHRAPGVPFLFFIDPNAGCDRVLFADNRIELEARDAPGFTSTWLPTDQYRRRFGYLSYACAHGTTVGDIREDRLLIPSFDAAALIDPDGMIWGYPDELIDAGCASLTSRVYPSERLIHSEFEENARELEADRRRQLLAIEDAIKRVCALIY